MLKILNLYAGIGGNRKLWSGDIEVVAIELDPKIAQIYQDFFPNDKVIVADAHQYLLDHFKEFDFIWSSPPCPTHSRFNLLSNVQEGKKVIYPNMELYQEIIYLKHWCKAKWVVENVISYYDPLIQPAEINNHYFWANFYINPIQKQVRKIRNEKDHIKKRAEQLGFDISKYKLDSGLARKILNNCTEPELGLHIFQEAYRTYKTLI
jgi:DNA (cytosine-5)-methyltransferase 1